MNGEVGENVVGEIEKELEEKWQEIEEYLKWIGECT